MELLIVLTVYPLLNQLELFNAETGVVEYWKLGQDLDVRKYKQGQKLVRDEKGFIVNISKVRIYDNSGETFDRYTAVYMEYPERHSKLYAARAMSENPFHPQGFGQYCTAMPGRHLGRRVEFHELPIDCQKLIIQDLEG